jgi:hypothetical protein
LPRRENELFVTSSLTSLLLSRITIEEPSSLKAQESTMKKIAVFLATVLLIGAMAPAAAQQFPPSSKADRAAIERNLLLGLASDNIGLQHSCALMLGKIRSSKAVFPLMAVLHSNSDVALRTAAAYALCRIGNSAGTYAVKMAVRFDDDAGVRLKCAWYYKTYVAPSTFAMQISETIVIAAVNN